METKIFDPMLPSLHLACLLDDVRFNMRLIRIQNNVAYCTNAHMIAAADLLLTTNFTKDMITALEGKTIHMDAWKEMCKSTSIDVKEDCCLVNVNGVEKALYFTECQGEFFKIVDIIIDAKEISTEKIDVVSFNPKLINIASKIINSEDLIFSFTAKNKGHILFSNSMPGIFCLVMPKLIEGSKRELFTW